MNTPPWSIVKSSAPRVNVFLNIFWTNSVFYLIFFKISWKCFLCTGSIFYINSKWQCTHSLNNSSYLKESGPTGTTPLSADSYTRVETLTIIVRLDVWCQKLHFALTMVKQDLPYQMDGLPCIDHDKSCFTLVNYRSISYMISRIFCI